MLKILTIVGARPQIIKASAISRKIQEKFSCSLHETIVHTGQHYDSNMSAVFFEELHIPYPKYNLNVGSSSHSNQTAKMMTGLYEIFIKEKPDYVLVYGDTNSTLAASLTASKIHIPIIHIEAGLRSFNKSMPEEINRIVCDHVSTLLFTPTKTGLENLQKEGFANTKPKFNIDNPGIFLCGDIMLDNSLHFSKIANDSYPNYLISNNITPDNYVLCTIHRPENTDNNTKLINILKSIEKIANKYNLKIIIPLHPRTKLKIDKLNIKKILNNNKNIIFMPPVSYLEMIILEKNSKLIMTDSGGVQKEAYFFNKPCIVFRNETEWIEIMNTGYSILCSDNQEKIVTSFDILFNKRSTIFPKIFGNGKASEFICNEIIKNKVVGRNS